jgi:hypothetical protein
VKGNIGESATRSGPVGKEVSSAVGWDDLAGVRLLSGLAPDQVESCSLRGGVLTPQASVEGHLQKRSVLSV